MNELVVMGFFAIYVVVVSLLRLLLEKEIPRLRAMKRIWGRTRGVLIHFLTDVLLPLVLGIVYLARGLAGGL